ncbi:ribonuclease III [Candidatus Saccharibacteria bacterium]|nr:ribonuclease III [Candidatus Saccharibacteria bacterium]MCR5699875.1 ribonuclease III [Candidatus Saccharibacteria bacterium]
MDITPYREFAKTKLGFEFNDINLLVTALTHRSYVNEHQKSVKEHNERLEYLGDAVLELVTSDFLYRNYDYPEGVMTALRAALVRTESIGDAGKELGYEPLVRLSKGEQKGTERAHESILADCFEAVIGAIYLDQGYEAARDFIAKHILVKIDTILEEESWRDPKSYMQELAQKSDGATPVYQTLKEEGPDHDKLFTVGVYVSGKLKGTGVGHSKQEAQTEAAREGIKKYRQAK